MEEQPDFLSLAELWLSRDPRSQDLDEDSRSRAISRLAEALRSRREGTHHPDQDVGLIVNVPRESLIPGKGLDEDALDQLSQYIQERIDENGV